MADPTFYSLRIVSSRLLDRYFRYPSGSRLYPAFPSFHDTMGEEKFALCVHALPFLPILQGRDRLRFHSLLGVGLQRRAQIRPTSLFNQYIVFLRYDGNIKFT